MTSTTPSRRPEVPLQTITPDDVRASVERAKGGLSIAAEEIVWQIEREAWVTLGYKSWDAMREAEYGGAAFMVPPKNRPELVARMRAAGLTQREVADTAGVTAQTIYNDERKARDPKYLGRPMASKAEAEQSTAVKADIRSMQDELLFFVVSARTNNVSEMELVRALNTAMRSLEDDGRDIDGVVRKFVFQPVLDIVLDPDLSEQWRSSWDHETFEPMTADDVRATLAGIASTFGSNPK
ncbi:hypothetical protein [Janibacter sp. G1551]|uniref:hypothetical protein n=1 Tax=Janibacter sp. G1551 TaxID=3420440 RepID=UPI003CFD31C8